MVRPVKAEAWAAAHASNAPSTPRTNSGESISVVLVGPSARSHPRGGSERPDSACPAPSPPGPRRHTGEPRVVAPSGSGASGSDAARDRAADLVASWSHGPKEHPRLARGRLPPVVPGRAGQGRAGRQRAGARHHGHPSLRVLHLGADAGRDRRPHQGGRGPERLFPALHPRELPAARSCARRGLQPRARRGHPRRRQEARRARRGAADERDHHQRLLLQVDPELPGAALPDQPVGQRGALGAPPPALPADHRIPVAGGPHRPRHGGRCAPLRAAHPARRVRGLHGGGPRRPGADRSQDRPGALLGSHHHAGRAKA